mmetsp:Transcript_27278/g.76161  ORF Transcript_27278/g.76161 Transcript_27278/m.76161 type:complete len:106 (+) Transcript_27278:136-453(+)|eukprot:CAMPEP_0119131388 /NCGR_PEP_ID=MMETSP1310-20130426/10279_1 /TAXON_ID=464262 /ORGANISM="Genus nov. species nov., Strain RCC2339" /LENGTH=105 /DNA_ID=CAMNT_0007121961 /DNA_START=124 /DNA_END=441 /DNA_ORIENTATION=+
MAPRARHTIILVQQTPNMASRTFYDYESLTQAMNGVCRLFEEQLKRKNPHVANITYDINDLYGYIDGIFDMSALFFNHQTNMYEPFGRDWIKDKVLQHLKRLCQQ